MNRLADRLTEGLELTEELLAEKMLEPDPDRRDWPAVSVRAEFAVRTFRDKVLPLHPRAVGETLDADATRETRVLHLAQEVAALAHVAGDAAEADRILSTAEALADAETAEEMAAARRQPDAFVHLNHGLWLQRHGERRAAGRRFRQARGKSNDPAFRRALRRARAATPADGPSRHRVLGFGTDLHGQQDVRADGSYRTLYCLFAFWIPLVPLAAFRMRKAASGRDECVARESLDRASATWRALAAATVAALVIGIGVSAYLSSPSRQLGLALHDARAAEAAGDSNAAYSRYRVAAVTYGPQTDVGEAIEGMLRVLATSVKEPCTAEQMPAVTGVVAAFETLPASVPRGAAADRLAQRLEQWAGAIGDDGIVRARAALAVLEMAARVAPDRGAARMAHARRRLADQLAVDRPLDALLHYARLEPDAPTLRARYAVLAGLGDASALWVEAEPEVRDWIGSARASMPAEMGEVAGRLQRAQDAESKHRALVADANESQLRQALAASPGSHTLVVAVAAARRARGDAAGCLRELSRLGPEGRLPAAGRRLLGQCLADGGDNERAERVLEVFLEDRLAPFQQARKAYDAAAEKKRAALSARYDDGEVPDVSKAVEAAATGDAKREAYDIWVEREMAADRTLEDLRARYLRLGTVVPASLALGTLQLRRGSEAEGEPRLALLNRAQATFLSVHAEAEGSVELKLGLGQVYHRLGKPEEGDRELNALVARKDPELTLDVAEVYRELGLAQRAQSLAEDVYRSTGADRWKYQAASKIALLVHDLDEAALWLSRCDPTSPRVTIDKLEVEARRKLRDGDPVGADRAYAQAAAYHDRAGAHDPIAVNNAAVALLGRFDATGDLAHLNGAIQRLEVTVVLQGDNTIALSNLASALETATAAEVLGRRVRARVLLLSEGERRSLQQSLLLGAERAALLDELTHGPYFSRLGEATRQEAVLAPWDDTPFWREERWLSWQHDAAGLERLARRLEARPSVERKARTPHAEPARPTPTPAPEGAAAKERQRRVIRSNARLARARAAGHVPTLAAAWMLHGDVLADTTCRVDDVAACASVIAAYRKAAELWPGAGFESDVAAALLKKALFEVTVASPALKQAWDAASERRSLTLLAYEQASSPAGADLLAAFRAHADLRESARLRRGWAADTASSTDWVVARLTGDAELQRLAGEGLRRRDAVMDRRVEAALRESVDKYAEAVIAEALGTPAEVAAAAH